MIRDAGSTIAPRLFLASLAMLGACAPSETSPDLGPDLGSINLREVRSVGVVEGAVEEQFGQIADVQATEDGSFFVLDRQGSAVAWFNLAGSYVGGIRTRGQGPGELSSPLAIAVRSTQTLFVLDPPNGRISVYELEGGAIAYERQIPSTWSSLGMSRSLCSVQGRSYVRGPAGGLVIHELDARGGVIDSFSEAESATADEFGPFVETVMPQLNAGLLLCSGDLDLIVTVGAMSSRVRAYTLDGEPVWDEDLAAIHPRRFMFTGRALRAEPQIEEGFHQVRSIVLWDSNTLLVQYSWHPADGALEGRDFDRLDTVMLALSDGRELGRTEHLPLVADVRDDVVYSFENLPYPRVRLFTRAD